MAKSMISLKVRIGGEDGFLHVFKGRAAFALDRLMVAGDRGLTPITDPAPRWSDYVFKLRRAGVVVETIDEEHFGPYAGTHARYVLRSPVEVISEVRA